MTALQLGFLIVFIVPQILFFVVLWGSGIVYMCHSYLNDGDSEIWAMHNHLSYSIDTQDIFVYFGLFGMIASFLLSIVVAGITLSTGDLIPIISLSLAGLLGTLYTLRAVIRLNKKLDKHSVDKDAHK